MGKMKKLLYLLVLPLLAVTCKTNKTQGEDVSYQRVSPEFCADSAYTYVAKQCAYGPRTMNSEAHEACGEWIAGKFEALGAKVTRQDADLKLYDGTPIKSRNIIAQINTEAAVRIMICSHWDSRPWADHDMDKEKHRSAIDGANDGASGVGIMLEIARQIRLQGDTCKVQVGVDFVCFDAEDCGTPEFDDDDADHSDTWCLGSQYWGSQRVSEGYCPKYGILLDMVGGRNTVFKKEMYSMRYAPSIVDKVWNMGYLLGYGEYFKNAEGGGITDDHVQVNLSGIPCIDIIGCDKDASDFSFPKTWHTVNDNVHNIDKNVLKAVGQVLMEVIWNEK